MYRPCRTNLSIRRLDEETARRLKVCAAREGKSLEETVRCILRAAVVDEEPLGTLIRRIVGRGFELRYLRSIGIAVNRYQDVHVLP